MMLYMTVASF